MLLQTDLWTNNINNIWIIFKIVLVKLGKLGKLMDKYSLLAWGMLKETLMDEHLL